MSVTPQGRATRRDGRVTPARKGIMGLTVTTLKPSWTGLRPALFALALMAVLLRVAVPPGFMVGEARADGGLPLVVCTGHGLDTLGGLDRKTPADKPKPDAPCAFAGIAAFSPAPAAVMVPVVFRTAQTAPAVARADQIPGRGLAAPPPPPIGPPRLI